LPRTYLLRIKRKIILGALGWLGLCIGLLATIGPNSGSRTEGEEFYLDKLYTPV